ncbi:aminotransferase class I/II-fold pyridoxal phosphate-dependent enzyme [Candidatus Peregrinibacteria bacterium]|nr:aminotransferase class I/II-fold pyridoxal phosphate-dependent enzyme [Candidatus Peregrinibacteria bacterium]
MIKYDPISAEILKNEELRQLNEMELIASENYTSIDVQTALGSILTNKYSEGYPGKRYYAGQEFTDQAENLAIERAKRLFNCKFANVQPLSGAPANFATLLALLKPGQKIMGMSLSHGGHLTHGSEPSFTSTVWKSVQYGVDPETGLINYDDLKKIAEKEKPDLILAGFSAHSRSLDWKKFKEIADSIGAYTMADIAHIAGFVATGQLENPLDHGFDVVTTTTHKTLRGPRGGLILTNHEDLSKKINFAVFPGFQGGPHMNNVLAKAIAFNEALQPEFKTYTKQVIKNAQTLANELKNLGVEIITDGTDNHIVLFNCLSSFNIGGKQAQLALEQAGLSTNKNTIPNETRSPFDPSGIRLGTAAMTTRGFKEAEFKKVAELIDQVLKNPENPDVLDNIKNEVKAICKLHPLPH